MQCALNPFVGAGWPVRAIPPGQYAAGLGEQRNDEAMEVLLLEMHGLGDLPLVEWHTRRCHRQLILHMDTAAQPGI